MPYEPVEPIRNRKNFSKYARFYFEPGATAMLQVLRWLYKYPGHLEDLVDHIDKKLFNKADYDKFQQIKDKKLTVKELDVTLLFKAIQLITDAVATRNDPIWFNSCPLDKIDELEHQLYLIKEGRNGVGHVEKKLRNLTDNDIIDECTKLTDSLSSIIRQAGIRATTHVNQLEIEDVCQLLQKDLERIRDGQEVLDTVICYIYEPLKAKYCEKLHKYFTNEVKRYYSCPSIIRKSEYYWTICRNFSFSGFSNEVLEPNRTQFISYTEKKVINVTKDLLQLTEKVYSNKEE